MFVIHDADTTIYLFGTFHALDGDPRWLENGVRSAFEQSDELVLETLLPEGPNASQEIRQAITAPSAKPSAAFLTTTRMAINASRRRGCRSTMAPTWSFVTLPRRRESPSRASNSATADEHVQSPARRRFSCATGESGRGRAGSPMQSLSTAMSDLQSAWKRGDQSVFVRMLDQLDSSAPETYRMMFTERNTRWADWMRLAFRRRAPSSLRLALAIWRARTASLCVSPRRA